MRLPQEHRLRACGGTPRRGPEAEGGQNWGGWEVATAASRPGQARGPGSRRGGQSCTRRPCDTGELGRAAGRASRWSPRDRKELK